MLVSFGTFWTGEGIGVHWPGSDLAIPVLVAAYGLAAWALVAVLQRSGSDRRLGGIAAGTVPAAGTAPPGRAPGDLRPADAASRVTGRRST